MHNPACGIPLETPLMIHPVRRPLRAHSRGQQETDGVRLHITSMKPVCQVKDDVGCCNEEVSKQGTRHVLSACG
jgi:hypothetical protein